MVGRGGSVVTEADAAGIDDENSGQLPHVSLGYPQPVPPGHSIHTFDNHLGGEQRPGRSLLETKSPVEMFFCVGNHGEGNLEALLERGRLLDAAQSDKYHPDTQLIKGLFFTAQLRHLLAAERSTEMPQKNQHQWSFLPELAQPAM